MSVATHKAVLEPCDQLCVLTPTVAVYTVMCISRAKAYPGTTPWY